MVQDTGRVFEGVVEEIAVGTADSCSSEPSAVQSFVYLNIVLVTVTTAGYILW